MAIPLGLLLRQLGLGPLAHYLVYQVQLRSGVIRRRTPAYAWEDRPLARWTTPGHGSASDRTQFHFDRSPEAMDRLGRMQAESELPAAQVANEILRGEFRLFGGEPVALGFPPDWGRVPLGGDAGSTPVDRHWTGYLGDQRLDYRLLWELSRFGWAYPLGRAYLLGQQRRHAEGFFQLLDSWRAANPPNVGPNWISAQELALRIMALSFGCFAFSELIEAAPPWRERLLTTIAAHAERIPPTLRYAKAQRNNHLILEAVGLYTAGLLFPMLRGAGRWKSAGRRLLISALDDQVFPDGGYIQHSTNYHRLALSAGLWMARLAETNAEPLPEASLDTLGRMAHALAAVVDPSSGRAINLGSNDGSDILPLSGCAHADYRPVLQAAALAFTGRPLLERGPWDETGLWLGLEATEQRRGPAEQASARRQGRAAAAGPQQPAAGQANSTDLPRAGKRASPTDLPHTGLYFVRGEHGWAALRCAQFTSRPSQSDQLHLDLWWGGRNLARDPGSYRYTESGFELAAAHNTLVADDQEPMHRVRRFLWIARYRAKLLGRWSSDDGKVESLAAEQRLPGGLTHRRSLVRAGDTLWVVIDDLLGSGEHAARVAWLLPDWDWELEAGELALRTEPDELILRVEPQAAGLALYRAGEQIAGAARSEPPSSVGWWAPSYGRREPALTLIARLRGSLPLRLTSWWHLGEPDPSLAFADDPLAEFVS